MAETCPPLFIIITLFSREKGMTLGPHSEKKGNIEKS